MLIHHRVEAILKEKIENDVKSFSLKKKGSRFLIDVYHITVRKETKTLLEEIAL